jgi:hypothetical protein
MFVWYREAQSSMTLRKCQHIRYAMFDRGLAVPTKQVANIVSLEMRSGRFLVLYRRLRNRCTNDGRQGAATEAIGHSSASASSDQVAKVAGLGSQVDYSTVSAVQEYRTSTSSDL